MYISNVKTLGFLILIILSTNTMIAQVHFFDLFALEGTEWSVGETSSVSPPSTVDDFYYIKLQGEELINDTLYHKIVNISGFEGNEIDVLYYLRIDSDSLLYLRDTYGNEEMIFDYSLLPGESFHVDFWIYRGQIYYDVSEPIDILIEDKIVESFNGTDRIVWELSFSGKWIKGLGSTSYLLDIFQIPLGYTGYTTSLLCAYYNENQIYSNPDFGFCDETYKINFTSDQVCITPNPFNNKINILFPEVQNAKIQIIDITGSTLLSIKTIEKDVIINLDGLKSGIYFLKIKSKYHSEIKRIIKI